MLYLFFTILGFALGSTLFAYWTPKIIRHIDIRELPADHNPGVANAFMYGGFFCGLLSLILELAKGFVPVFLGQRFLDTHSLLFIPVLIAPVFGHAFPFFRKEKGGKASEFQISYPFPSENYSPEHSVIHNYGVRNYVCRSAVILWTCTQSVAFKLQNRSCKQYDLRLSVCSESSC